MEAALASGVLKVAGNKLASLIASEFAAITGLKKDLSELQDIHGEITSWMSLLRDGSVESDPQFRWVIKLKDLAYDIDDLLYKVHLEAEKHKINGDGNKHAIANCFCANPESFRFRCKVAHKIKVIKVRLATIAKQRTDMNSVGHNIPVDQYILSRNRANGELSLLTNVEESQIPTRDQEKDEIICNLIEPNKGEDGWIVSAVGLGGSGKTTLAKHVCHDKTIKEHFKDKIFWVHVSQEFDLEKLIAKLFEAITKIKSDLNAPQFMVDEISNNLTGKKFLLVLDDAWHKTRHDWEQLMAHLTSGAPGSKILLTTRDRKVAEVVKSSHIFQLAFLSDNESWILFLKSSRWVEEELGSEFIRTGKEILKKCGGVPLAIKMLGGALCDKREIDTWRSVRESSLWNVKDIKDSVFTSLKLSYLHLADHLKQCFTFCSVFPKGNEINKDHLISQWIAHGFINPSETDQPEVIGNEYLYSLVKVGFLQEPYETWDTKQLACKMHDLIHDLTRWILQDEVLTSLSNNVKTNCIHRCRYLCLTSCTDKVQKGLDKVHSVSIAGGNPSLNKLIKKICFARSVTLHYTTDSPFPQSLLKFEYLGYLEIRGLHCTELPQGISGCWNLQALIFINCHGFVTLPDSIGKLKKLRTLELTRVIALESLPQSIGSCRDLQCLQLYLCRSLRMIPKSISKLENLRVFRIVSCTSVQQQMSESIVELRNIRTINLAGCWGLHDLPSTFASRNLRTLNLSGTRVTTLPDWVTFIGTLECIDLEDCSKLVELPRGIGNLKKLEVLNIYGCWNLHCMPLGFGQLTHLRKLDLFVVGCGEDDAKISELENLDLISGENGEFEITNLQYLKDPGDAEKACLKKKKNIRKLTFIWSSGGTEEEPLSDMVKDLGVLDALEPPSEITELKIRGYRGLHLPCWMGKQSDPSDLEGVVLKKTSSIRFVCLSELKLENLHNLKHMHGILVLPALKFLRLDNMPNLEELWTTTRGFEIGEEHVGEQNCFPVLSHLEITDCPNLLLEPYFPPSLERLMLGCCSNPLLPKGSSISNAVPHLKHLELNGMTGSSIEWGFLQYLTILESLDIVCCTDMTELPGSMRGLTSLRRLMIYECSTLAVLPEWLSELHPLQDLNVSRCSMLADIPQSIEHLTSLKNLQIDGLGNLKQLPEAIQHLTSLEHLKLASCHALTALPKGIGQLSALLSLSIHVCSALQSLPRSIKHLTALQRLYIIRCPDLVRLYQKEAGGRLRPCIPYS